MSSTAGIKVAAVKNSGLPDTQNMEVEQKIKEIQTIMGENTLFSVGVDSMQKRMDIIEAKICREVPNFDIMEEPDYMG